MKLNISYPANGSQKLYDIGTTNLHKPNWPEEVSS